LPLSLLGLLGVSPLAWGATLEGAPAVRASIDDDGFVAARAPVPRHIRSSLDDAGSATSAGSAAFPSEGNALVLPPLPRRMIRVSLDQDQPAFAGRLIRLSLDEGRNIYGRLSDSTLIGRQVRTSLD
jgi:hypothetical protein